MRAPVELPEIPESEQTPWVKRLLMVLEELAQRVQQLEEEKGQLQKELAVLKDKRKRPHVSNG